MVEVFGHALSSVFDLYANFVGSYPEIATILISPEKTESFLRIRAIRLPYYSNTYRNSSAPCCRRIWRIPGTGPSIIPVQKFAQIPEKNYG